MGGKKVRKLWHDVRSTSLPDARGTYSNDDRTERPESDHGYQECSSDGISEDEHGGKRYHEGRRRQGFRHREWQKQRADPRGARNVSTQARNTHEVRQATTQSSGCTLPPPPPPPPPWVVKTEEASRHRDREKQRSKERPQRRKVERDMDTSSDELTRRVKEATQHRVRDRGDRARAHPLPLVQSSSPAKLTQSRVPDHVEPSEPPATSDNQCESEVIASWLSSL
eukprot:6466533-Amphidinium_carterae.1